MDSRRLAAVFLALPLLALTVAAGTGTGPAAGAAGLTAPGAPAFVRQTLRATALPRSSASSVPGIRPVGTLVPPSDVVAAAVDSRRLHFGLAVYRSLMVATYPVVSTDGGVTWRVDGPRFYVAAAQAPNATSSVGALAPRGAFFWGRGGNVVKVTTDAGHHWWVTGFAAGVALVTASHGTLRSVALGNQVQGGDFQAFMYVSRDNGRTWEFDGELPDLKP